MFQRILRGSIAIRTIVQNGANTKQGLLNLARPRHQMGSGPGHYMIVLTDDNDQAWFAQYVGQSFNVSKRLRNHEFNCRGVKEKKLLYTMWRKQGIEAHYVPLHSVVADFGEDEKDQATWLNLVEMFYCLVFETLQPSMLAHWLKEFPFAGDKGLNTQLPIHQGDNSRAENSGYGSICKSNDAKIRQLGFNHMNNMRAAALVKQKADNYVNNSAALFAANGAPRHREPIEGDKLPVKIKCGSCKSDASIRNDDAPKFCVNTGKYLVRQLRCEGECTLRPSESRRKMPCRRHYPIDRPKSEWLTGEATKVIAKRLASKQPSRAAAAPSLQEERSLVEEEVPLVVEQEDILEGGDLSELVEDVDPSELGGLLVGEVDVMEGGELSELMEDIDPTELDGFLLVDEDAVMEGGDLSELLEDIDPSELVAPFLNSV
ncbi:hypothetical protein QQX98_005980 [Neonectria punicea]|uniref:GIY-YIG domain-containing protein n=1 Tax=Neonectria punicea TaxID=979145 RepID=A0ABR1H2K8_9HYPO